MAMDPTEVTIIEDLKFCEMLLKRLIRGMQDRGLSQTQVQNDIIRLRRELNDIRRLCVW